LWRGTTPVDEQNRPRTDETGDLPQVWKITPRTIPGIADRANYLIISPIRFQQMDASKNREYAAGKILSINRAKSQLVKLPVVALPTR
jgi:hypothetical protein